MHLVGFIIRILVYLLSHCIYVSIEPVIHLSIHRWTHPDFFYMVSNFILQMSVSKISIFPISEQERTLFPKFQETKYGTKLNKHKTI